MLNNEMDLKHPDYQYILSVFSELDKPRFTDFIKKLVVLKSDCKYKGEGDGPLRSVTNLQNKLKDLEKWGVIKNHKISRREGYYTLSEKYKCKVSEALDKIFLENLSMRGVIDQELETVYGISGELWLNKEVKRIISQLSELNKKLYLVKLELLEKKLDEEIHNILKKIEREIENNEKKNDLKEKVEKLIEIHLPQKVRKSLKNLQTTDGIGLPLLPNNIIGFLGRTYTNPNLPDDIADLILKKQLGTNYLVDVLISIKNFFTNIGNYFITLKAPIINVPEELEYKLHKNIYLKHSRPEDFLDLYKN